MLKLAVRIGSVPAEFDPAAKDLSLSLWDDNEIYAVTIPAGTMQEKAPGRFVFRDRSGNLSGIRRAVFKIRRSGEGSLRLRTGRLDLSNADRTEHMVRVEITIGTYDVSHTRLWEAMGNRLAPRSR